MIVDLDTLDADALANLAAARRLAEAPPDQVSALAQWDWLVARASDPSRWCHDTAALVDARSRYLGLIHRVTAIAADLMSENYFDTEEIAAVLPRVAAAAGLSPDDATEAVNAGLSRAGSR